MSLGTVTANTTGGFTITVTIPAGTAVGSHTITAVGATSGTTLTFDVNVVASAVQLTGPYELYCPGTPVGTIALNDASTVATIAPASPTSGQQFNVTGYQTTVNIPNAIVTAASALGNTAIAGSATAQIDVSGATPTTMSTGTMNFSVPIPNPVPSSGLTLKLPDPAGSIGPFTAGSGGITVQQDSVANLTLQVSGNPLSLSCTAYANNSVATGITTATPSGGPIDPIIAFANGGSTTTTTTTKPTTTTTGPATAAGGGTSSTVVANSSSLAFTGPGAGTKILALAGAILVLFGLLLLGVVDAPKRALRALAFAAPSVHPVAWLANQGAQAMQARARTKQAGAQAMHRTVLRAQRGAEWLIGRR